MATADAGTDAGLLHTRGIYQLTTARVLDVFARLDLTGADAVLMRGTGMPTLRAMAQLTGAASNLHAGNGGASGTSRRNATNALRTTGLPLLSSNLCLAWALDQAGVPRGILDSLEAMLAQVIAQAHVQTKLTELGLNPGFMARAHYTAFIQNEIRTWGPLIRAAGVKGN